MLVIPFWGFVYLLIGVIVAYKNDFKGGYFIFWAIAWLPAIFVALGIIGLMVYEERKGSRKWKR